MATSLARLNAVIAALEKIQAHLSGLDRMQDVETTTYNRWIGMLDGVVDGNWKNLSLEPDTTITVEEMMMHVDAAIAFLTAHGDDDA